MMPDQCPRRGSHYIDFTDMATDAERVHLVSTAIPTSTPGSPPRPATQPLRGTAFLNAPQHSDPTTTEHTAQAIRNHLTLIGDVDDRERS
jgi:hypothetical protein